MYVMESGKPVCIPFNREMWKIGANRHAPVGSIDFHYFGCPTTI